MQIVKLMRKETMTNVNFSEAAAVQLKLGVATSFIPPENFIARYTTIRKVPVYIFSISANEKWPQYRKQGHYAKAQSKN
ncbi:hypothetical protein T06_10227 [Trichinella sp. T6]|nr:hypothetical protein T06_10227 [Trichinella sp. T6]